MTTPFEDTSIFQNVLEWTDNDNQMWRAEWSGGVWKVSKINEGVAEFFRSVKGGRKNQPKQVHAAAML